MASHFIVECLDCGHNSYFYPTAPNCPRCGGSWREARYDYSTLSHSLPLQLPGRPFDIWRYHELLPVRSPNADLSLGEGGTPLIRATNLGLMLGCPNIFIKDERQGPTASFKDRQAAVAIAAFKEAGITEVVVASTGNVAIAYSAYAARAGIKLWAFLTSLVPAAKMREVALYGTQVIKVTGSYDQAKQVAAEFAKQRGLCLDGGSRSILCVEAMKTIAFEISEQLTALLGPPSSTAETPANKWRVPDWYFQSVSGGLGPLGVIKGFTELKQMGLTNNIPQMAIIQAEGCSPMVQAWKQGKETVVPVQVPNTLIAPLASGDPGRTYTLLRQYITKGAGGEFESVTDEEAFRSVHHLAKMEGLSVEPAAAVAFAGLVKLVRAGRIKTSDVVVINCTGHTMPIERNILGEGWLRDLALPSQAMEESSEEGLLAALSKVGINRFLCIEIVDNNPIARLLICRILQSQGNFKLFEVSNGREAVEVAKKEHPDLIILDLMLPELGGFGVMDALQIQQDTAGIPIIMVTSKELTPAEKERLNIHIQSLMQKGDFASDDLAEDVRTLLS